jgi:hypothetical protein
VSAKLSPKTEQHIAAMFPADCRAEVAELLLQQCGNNLPLLNRLDEFQLERFRFAALKLSAGNMDRLKKAIELAKTDWRDLLVAAEFANDIKAHSKWMPSPSSEEE